MNPIVVINFFSIIFPLTMLVYNHYLLLTKNSVEKIAPKYIKNVLLLLYICIFSITFVSFKSDPIEEIDIVPFLSPDEFPS